MADAEDVLIGAMERLSRAARRRWAQPAAFDLREHELRSAQLRIERWLVACFGYSLPVVVCDSPAPAGWLRCALERVAPWEIRPEPVVATNGATLFVPREALRADASPAGHSLLAPLALGRRCAASFELRSHEPTSPLHRDVRWVLEAALGDTATAQLLPGLAALLDRARDAALASRPIFSSLRPAERAVEDLVRALLRGPASAAARSVSEFVGGLDPAQIDDFAHRLTARVCGPYRGVAPVKHWGIPWPSAHVCAQRSESPRGADRDAPARPEPRELSRSVRRRPLPQEEARRPGPFIVAPSDPHLALEDARGLDRPEDRGSEDADALAAELSGLDELTALRSDRPVSEILVSGDAAPSSLLEPLVTPSRVTSLCYPEWDFRRGAYRIPGVALREEPVPRSDMAWVAGTRERHGSQLRALRRQFAALQPRREHLPRQIEGDEIDIDAWVGQHAERRSGRSVDGRFYRDKRPRRRDLAVALLVDVSGSTDAWVSRDTRVIDVAKQAALCLAEALSAVGDRYAIYGFSGRGANDVRVWVAKRFPDRLDDAARARIGGLQPDRSTRLGGPIRHVTDALGRISARVRLLLVLSDGKPNDDDVYESDYGVEDVRRAVFEAERAGVRTFCVTIDRRGPAYLPRLFGPTGYTLLWDAAQLPRRLPQIYRHLRWGAST